MAKQRLIYIQNHCPGLTFKAPALRTFLRRLERLERYPIPHGELSVVFVTLDRITQLHHQFLADPTPTDVITFPGDSLSESAGEICICAEYARSMAKRYRTTLNHELLLYLVHGWLHLAGLKDANPAEQKVMRQAEAWVLGKLEESFLHLFREVSL